MLDKVILLHQECEGNYLFHATPVVTPKFLITFGDEALKIISESLTLVQQINNPDYLQVLQYRKQKFYCISGFERGKEVNDYMDTDYFYINFLLPDEY